MVSSQENGRSCNSNEIIIEIGGLFLDRQTFAVGVSEVEVFTFS
jgi:hypothetical protein